MRSLEIGEIYPQGMLDNIKRLIMGSRGRPTVTTPEGRPVLTEPPSAQGRGEIAPPRFDPRMPSDGRLIHFQGKDRAYEIEHYIGAVYEFNKPLLRGIITNLNTQVFYMDPRQSKKEVKKNMEASGANAMLFRRKGSDEFVGFAIFRRMRILGSWVFYIAERGILETDREQHLGRASVIEALRVYREDLHEPVDIIASRGQNGAAFLSIIETNELEGELVPLQKKYTDDSKLRAVEIALYRNIRNKSSLGLDPDTGVSREEYSEGENKAYKPNPLHARVMAFHNVMVKKLKVNFSKGDAVYALGWAKKHNGNYKSASVV